MKAHHLLIFLLTAISFTSCQKERVWVKYSETGCADPWGGSWQPHAEKVSSIKAFFSGVGVEVFGVAIETVNLPDACDACHCLTGNVIRCEVREKDLPVMLEQGFTAD
jgi:hypothetical protein